MLCFISIVFFSTPCCFHFVCVCSSNVDLCLLYHYQEMNFQKSSLGVCKWYNSSNVAIAMATQQC